MNARNEPMTGLIRGLSNATYHATAALGASGLKRLAQSPAHYYGAALHADRPVVQPTPAMAAGTLAHCLILEPEALSSRYIVKPEGLDGRTKEGKAWTASVAPGLEVISADQLATAERQADAVFELPQIAELLATGEPEVSAFWIDDNTGTHCKCRPDWVTPVGDGVILLDVKTGQDASPAGFARSVVRFGYHLQAEWYSTGFEKASGQRVLGFVFVVVESDWPHAAAAYMLDEEAMTKARDENRRLVALHAECTTRNDWPAYSSEIQPLSLPAWA